MSLTASSESIEVKYEDKKSKAHSADETAEWSNFNWSKQYKTIQAKGTQTRLNWHALATHGLAYLLVLPFVIMLLYQTWLNPSLEIKIPSYYIALVSSIIGFYFGTKLHCSE